MRSLLLLVCLLAAIAAPALAELITYNGDVLPDAATPPWKLQTGVWQGSVADDAQCDDGKAYYINDADTGNRCKIILDTGATFDPVAGCTMIARVKCTSFSGNSTTELQNVGIFTAYGRNFMTVGKDTTIGQFLRIKEGGVPGDPSNKVVAISEGYHIIRMTFTDDGTDHFRVYLDEDPDTIFISDYNTRTDNAWGGPEFGAGGNAELQDLYYDYVTFDNTGAYPPGGSPTKVIITAGPTPGNVGYTTATVSWTTSPAADSTVYYGTDPGSLTSSVTDPTLVTDHVMNLTGLAEGTMYYFKAVSAAPGLDPAESGVLTFLTDAHGQPLNASFETGALDPWVRTYGSGGDYGVRKSPWNYMGVVAQHGQYFLGQAASGGSSRSVTSQQVNVTAGSFYLAQGWIWTDCWTVEGEQTIPHEQDSLNLIGIDPNGSMDPGYDPNAGDPLAASTASWSSWNDGSSQIPGTIDSVWKQIGAAAQAGTGGQITVHLLMHQQYGWLWHLNAFDNITICEATPITTIVDAKSGSDGYPVLLTDAVVTAALIAEDGLGGFGQVAFAVEEPARFAGIRVLSSTAVNAGDKVTISGSTAMERGERVINATSVTVNSSGNPTPAPFSITGVETGGGAFGAQGAVVDDATASPEKMSTVANNVGLLMRIRGKVRATYQPTPGTPSYNDYFYVDDAYGSTDFGYETGLKDGTQTDGVPNTGIKCRPAAGMFFMPGPLPAVGDYVEVTGVMGVRQMDGRNIRFFWTVEWVPATFETYNSSREIKWNLISLPGMPKLPDPAYVFVVNPAISPDPDLIDGKLYRWDGPTQGLIVYDMWAPDVFGAVSNAVGYWLNAPAAGPISYEGYSEPEPVLDRWISAPKGWNIISEPFKHSTYWADWKATDCSATKTIQEACQYPGSADWLQSTGYWWDAPTQGLLDYGLDDDFPTTNQLDQWHGYWFKAKKTLGLFSPAWSVAPPPP